MSELGSAASSRLSFECSVALRLVEMGHCEGYKTEGVSVRFFILWWETPLSGDWMWFALLLGHKNDVVASNIVVPESGISAWLLKAFCSFSSSKCGVIKYKMYVEELGKAERQQETVGNHNGHSQAWRLCKFSRSEEIRQW